MPEKNPTVSIIIPTYNRAHLIDWVILNFKTIRIKLSKILR